MEDRVRVRRVLLVRLKRKREGVRREERGKRWEGRRSCSRTKGVSSIGGSKVRR